MPAALPEPLAAGIYPTYFLMSQLQLTQPIRLAIIGAGALGQQIAQHARQDGRYRIAGFFDDTLSLGYATANGPVLGGIPAAQESHGRGEFDELLMGIGYNHLAARQRLFEQLTGQGIPFARFVHRSAWVDESARLGPGVFVGAGCLLDLNAELQANIFLNPGCTIAHDSTVEAHSFLAPAVHIAGNVRVGERNFLGIGTTLIDSVQLAADVRTGGGTVVTKNLEEAGTYVGVPARRLNKL